MYRFDVDYLDEERGIKHIPCDDGDYVLAEDALALQAKVEELEAENTRITIKYNANRIATGALERLARENTEYEEGNDADAEVIQLLQVKVEELETTVKDLVGVAQDSLYGRHYLRTHYPALSQEDE